MREALDINDVENAGSVGIKCARVAEGRRDVYIHPSRHLKEWDTCAPEALVQEAGGAVSDCRGRPLRYNRPDPSYQDGIVVAESSQLPWVLSRVVPIYEETRSAGRGVRDKRQTE
jgi:3'-phosphoadenosine 5'-phosphosulfate (PAPS) 3'-phosphatase